MANRTPSRSPPATGPGDRTAARGQRSRLIGRLFRGIVIVALVLWPLAGAVVFRLWPVPLTPLMVQRLIEGNGLSQTWVPLGAIAPSLHRAVLAAEDARFCRHHGFDWVEVQAAYADWQAGKGLRGASTLSMQTARTLLLWGGRDPLRKALEAWYTLILEGLWPKARILEVYLNIVEWGPGIYGAEAAARHHFSRSAAHLTDDEAARLAAILPNPRVWSANPPGPGVAARSRRVMARMATVPRPSTGAVCPQEDSSP